ncbi:MAG: lysine 2,3-aminomutase [Verrucomicrobia subdivision 6 bacterium BACL9 MAG-120820-bin42]|uniref:L-lysine 2,3-aminomutase n=2 Tax=Verrucomicrobia subdivision 6 TaxID=134627 RepID=A0A0R2XHF0_9BACT|nr:MAG: lysine 2,3-aminomutase [Verrucomicrobia subdivision 6 bacterium BACL9 MAG-120507-bin52]KRP32542.1 MAG: lysine 2,3-aminomutase [Verrucomicrobia subdivision 6 bacterium BACL9 MAG-120820-bin42]
MKANEFRPVLSASWGSVPLSMWQDWSWQLRNRIQTLEQLEARLNLTPEERAGTILAGKKLALGITPHFFSLIDRNDPDCPIRRQVVPRIEESVTAPDEMLDPCGEDSHMPVPGLVHRYPDRVLLLVTDRCASYCRYCTRSRVVSGAGEQELTMDLEGAFAYLEKHPEVRDVLLSGGDPLLLSDAKLSAILTRLRQIPSIEFIRIGTRIPIFLPQRITPELVAILKRHHPLWLSVHSNHPRELTQEVRGALEQLADAGIPLGNQSVLLKGVNDRSEVLKELFHKLLLCRVRPYYLYQCDLIAGSAHLRTTIREGQEIMEQLRGHTTGYAVPTYVVDGPGGGGKIPIGPSYIVGMADNRVILKNYKGDVYEYPEVGQNNLAGLRD